MDEEYEERERERVLSFLRGGDEWCHPYPSVTDFKQNLGEEVLEHVELFNGWVLYKEISELDHKISAVLKHFASDNWVYLHTLIQFWGVVKVEGSHHYLSSSHHPFYASCLNKGLCRYMKLCRDHEYVVDVEGGDAEQQLGGVGRVFRNRLPESTPDLRLYSTYEFPMRDEADRCGFRDYMALPLFDFRTDHCYGVLEIFQRYYSVYERNRLLAHLDGAPQIAGLKFNNKSIAITKEMRQPGSELLAVATIPSDSKPREREKRKNSLNLSAEALESHFGKKLQDAAKELGVGRSTIKRACREHGIRRWPNRREHKKKSSLSEEESVADPEQDMLPSTSNVHPFENVTQINTRSADKVIVKVKYNENIIKFELSQPLLGLARLTEEVATSLNMEMGNFKLKYADEDGDEILLTRDADLQLCPKTRTTTGEPLIRLLVR